MRYNRYKYRYIVKRAPDTWTVVDTQIHMIVGTYATRHSARKAAQNFNAGREQEQQATG